jgi:ATP:ADP antiporter, AAA family
LLALLRRSIDVKPEEVSALLWSFACFFFLLCVNYILRPIRDEMGIQGGVKNLPWMFTATFVVTLAAVPLYAAAVARFPRRRLVPLVYRFFALNLIAFFLAHRMGIAPSLVGRVFFVWSSVINVFVVSIFWSVMADLWKSEQGKRLFGFIAAGGSAGAILGPLLTALLVKPLGKENLLLGAVVLLELAVFCVGRLFHLASGLKAGAAPAPSAVGEARIGGSVLAGFGLVFRSPYLLGICAQTLLTTFTATVLYLQQMQLVEAGVRESAERVALFGQRDLVVNVLTIPIQMFITGRLISRAGLAVALSVVAVITGLGFLGLAFAPLVGVIIAFEVLRRAAHYGIERPAREVLFTVVSKEEKYKSKNFIDLVVYRGGDAASAWIHAALSSFMSVVSVSLAMIPLAGAWVALSVRLARGQARHARAESATMRP